MVLDINTDFMADIIVLESGEKMESEVKHSVWSRVPSSQTEVSQGIPFNVILFLRTTSTAFHEPQI